MNFLIQILGHRAMSAFEGTNSLLIRSDTAYDLQNIDKRIAWFTQRLASLRMERMMCQMSLGSMRIQADTGYLENIYVEHLCKLHEERQRAKDAASANMK